MSNEVAVPTIASSAFKVFIPISQWAGRKKDNRASAAVCGDNNAKKGVASVNKSLLGDCPHLKAISKLVGQVRNHYLYVHTLPWDDAGWRLLPTGNMFTFFEVMTELQNEFYRLVDVFIENYAEAKSDAIMELGDMFDANDYPSEDELRSKFSFRIDKEPIPESGDWRVDVQQQAVDDLKSEYEAKVNTRVQAAMDDVWGQLYKKLAHLSERLDYADHEKKKIFNATTVDSFVDLVDLLEGFNITGDPKMSQLQQDLTAAMRGITPEALREDGGLRAQTKQALDTAIKSLPSLL